MAPIFAPSRIRSKFAFAGWHGAKPSDLLATVRWGEPTHPGHLDPQDDAPARDP